MLEARNKKHKMTMISYVTLLLSVALISTHSFVITVKQSPPFAARTSIRPRSHSQTHPKPKHVSTPQTTTTARRLSSSDDTTPQTQTGRVLLISGSAPSGYGATSPQPNPSWDTVAQQLARRLRNFAGVLKDGSDVIQSDSIGIDMLRESPDWLAVNVYDVVLVLGVCGEEEEWLTTALANASTNASPNSIKALLTDPSCSPSLQSQQFAGSYFPGDPTQEYVINLSPWTEIASAKRLLASTKTLLSRKSSEDYLFALLFALHGLVLPLDVVKSDINPSWEKGLDNIAEFKKMCDKCLPQIKAAMNDPQTKAAIDLLNAVDLRDQVGSYRVIVSNETPQLEEFTLCILQQNDCFNCDAPILDRPKVPVLTEWRGEPLTSRAAEQIFVGHLDHPSSHECVAPELKQPWSWKIVVGANPAYDAFPMQHQIFYPVKDGKSKSGSLWYDPVFCVETIPDNARVWCKRHYRCTPRRHWSKTKGDGNTPGCWTLTTLDNGMMSEERWTTIDAADDLSWCVLHYSGVAKRAGQSYVGALLCTADGKWPVEAREGKGLERIRRAFQVCDLELWELFGGSTEETFMWSEEMNMWAERNPPPLEPIGDLSIQAWRKQEKEKLLKLQQ